MTGKDIGKARWVPKDVVEQCFRAFCVIDPIFSGVWRPNVFPMRLPCNPLESEAMRQILSVLRNISHFLYIEWLDRETGHTNSLSIKLQLTVVYSRCVCSHQFGTPCDSLNRESFKIRDV